MASAHGLIISSSFVNSLIRRGLLYFFILFLVVSSSLVIVLWTEVRNSLYPFFMIISLLGLALLYLRCLVLSSSYRYRCATRSIYRFSYTQSITAPNVSSFTYSFNCFISPSSIS